MRADVCHVTRFSKPGTCARGTDGCDVEHRAVSSECVKCGESEAEVERLRALVADARSYALSLNAGRAELPEWAQLRVDMLVGRLNGTALTEASARSELRDAWDRLRTEIATRVPNHLKSTLLYEALNDVEGGVRAAEVTPMPGAALAIDVDGPLLCDIPANAPGSEPLAQCSNCATERDEPHTWRECAKALAERCQLLENLAHDPEVARELLRSIAEEDTPITDDFWAGVRTEAAHQRDRWGSAHDAGKAPADWFWLVGYLAGKALHAHCDWVWSSSEEKHDKALHHTVSTAAALANWHAALLGQTNMRPGIEPPKEASPFTSPTTKERP